MTYPERICVVLGCGRAVLRSADGTWAYNRCEQHVLALLTGAFGPPARVLSRDEPEAGGVPRFDPPAHRGRPESIPVPSGA